MSVNLQTAVLGLEYGWKTILQQEGINYFKIVDINDVYSAQFSVLIIDEFTDPSVKEQLLELVNSGGMLLVSGKAWRYIFQNKTVKKYCSYLLPEINSFFSSTGIINIDNILEYPAQLSSALDKKLHIYKFVIGNGCLLIHPFDITKLISSSQCTRRNFYDTRNELPSEVVNSVSKSSIRKVLCLCVEYLWDQKKLPQIQKWYFPKKSESIFCFRIDTDFCTKSQTLEIYEMCKDYDIPATWFIETSSISMLNEVYNQFKNQELAFHGDKHLVFKTREKNKLNIIQGLNKMSAAGIKQVSGFASPFGEWNDSLGESLESIFEYSSEFSFDYDNFPSYPIVNGKYSNVLQIPIHPVSIGRLNRSHYSTKEMKSYYNRIIDEKICSNEPIILYYHPGNGRIDVLKFIFNKINLIKINKMFMKDFACFWKARLLNNISYKINNSILTRQSKHNSDYYIQLKLTKKAALVNPIEFLDVAKLSFEKKQFITIPKDIKKIREFTWRHYLYNYELKKTKARM